MTEAAEFWFNVRTHQVEEGRQSDWKDLLGPYGSRADAEAALARVRQNNEAADAADEESQAWDANPMNDAG